MIGIINYGMGNLASVQNAFDFIGVKSTIISNPGEISQMDKLVLPGVGAFGMAMENINKSGFADEIKESVLVKQKPIIGICLGMQLLLETSNEHGQHNGLGIIKGKVSYFGDSISNLPIPHMGWNNATAAKESILFKDIDPSASFYFVHSYFCQLAEESEVAAVTDYGITFHSSLAKGHIMGCQFHPEKSQKSGLQIFKNFNTL